MSRPFQDYANSGEIADLFIGGTTAGNEAVIRDDFASTINTVSQGLDPLAGYAQAGDRILVSDSSDGDLKSAYVPQIPGHMEIVQVAGDLGSILSLAEVTVAIPIPVVGRTYLLQGTGGNAFMAVTDGTTWWYERLTKCV